VTLERGKFRVLVSASCQTLQHAAARHLCPTIGQSWRPILFGKLGDE
jgi:hypothetical protein